jgi:uncharacterized membrane protein YoaT (DUF817 family)
VNPVAARPAPRSSLRDLLLFLWLQVRACIFAGAVFATLALSHVTTLGLPRYDFILIVLVLVQAGMYLTKLETLEEIKFITIFHLVGFVLEQFKTHMGSWAYPEFAYSKIADVPLYSGFMYAAVGSYIAQTWRLYRLEVLRAPRARYGWGLGALIYVNFFSNHYLPDVRFFLIAAVAALYWRTALVYHVNARAWRVPLPVFFALAGGLIWIAENLATFLGAWVYPNQQGGWRVVDGGKVTSWMLLVIISFILVQHLKTTARGREARAAVLARETESRDALPARDPSAP